jgi:hypothetical protein
MFEIVKPYIDFETAFCRKDGVHLKYVGLDLYLDYLKDTI